MNIRKRQASETLLPTRSAKQPRTTRQRYTGEGSSPSQIDGLLARWLSLGRDAWKLGCDTFTQIMDGQKFNEESPRPFPQPRIRRNSGPPPPPRPPLPLRPPLPMQFQQSTSRSTAPSLPPPSRSLPRETNFRIMDIHSIASPPRVLGSDTPAISYSTPSQHPQLEEALAASARRRQSSGLSDAIPRKYHNREHIYAKNHKALVQANRKKDREEMVKELFSLKRSTGYTSDLRTFKNYLGYRARLELLERREVLSPSPSLTDLRSQRATPAASRRHSFSEDINPDFLQRALEKARVTFNGPRPPKPFSPSLDQFRLSARAKDDEIERRLRGPKHPLPSHLPPGDEAKVDALLAKRGVVSKFSREQVTDKDISRLLPSQWLNDEIINFYGQMILARSEGCKENPGVNGVRHSRKKPLDVHYFSTFFWSKLKGEGYDKGRLAKWTKKIDLFQKDVILIPINHSNSHWTGAAINFRRKRIESYDSMGMGRDNVYKVLRLYLDCEHRNKKKKPFDFTGWEDYTLENTPQQENGFDCGVFTCQFLESLSRGEEAFPFTQDDMPYLRRRMIWEIGHAKLREEP